jgi:ribonuclease T2
MSNQPKPSRRYFTWTSLLGVGVLLAVYLLTQRNQAGDGQPQIVPPSQPAGAAQPASTANFDFYVLSLSWSPDYCASNGNSDPQECSIGKKLAFVLHGLWPQYNKGYPSNCSSEPLPAGVSQQYSNLYPSQTLMQHEWSTHGTCSGLTPEQYLAFSKRIKESVTIPDAYSSPAATFRTTSDQLVSAFLTANPALNPSGLSPVCSGNGRYLTEVRICFDTAGNPMGCSAEVLKNAAKTCQNADFQVRNVR